VFDVGFWELAVIFVLALLVLGPERLPKVAQQLGQWAGKARRMARVLTTQLQDELAAVDPNRIMNPPPARRPEPPVYNRPGVDDLKPGGSGVAQSADPPTAKPGTDSPPGDDARP